jgi:hypothetical protein
MITEAGYLQLLRVRGVALRAHWSVPVVAIFLGNLRFEPLLWLCFLAIVVVHELGHAALVRALDLEVVSIDLTGVGGECRWRGSADRLERAWIAWGGVLAQLGLLVLALVARLVLGAPETRAGLTLLHAFTETNLWIMAFNLLPIAPLDGARAWSLFGELERSGRSVSGFVLAPLSGWARRRRHRRASPGETATPPGGGAPSAPRGGRWRRRPRSAPPEGTPSGAPGSRRQEPNGGAAGPSEQPSAEAQRELAALLERIAQDAGKAKRRDR